MIEAVSAAAGDVVGGIPPWLPPSSSGCVQAEDGAGTGALPVHIIGHYAFDADGRGRRGRGAGTGALPVHAVALVNRRGIMLEVVDLGGFDFGPCAPIEPDGSYAPHYEGAEDVYNRHT